MKTFTKEIADTLKAQSLEFGLAVFLADGTTDNCNIYMNGAPLALPSKLTLEFDAEKRYPSATVTYFLLTGEEEDIKESTLTESFNRVYLV